MLNCSVKSNSLWPADCSVHGDSPGKNNGVGCHAFLQGIFPTQGSNPDLLYLWWNLSCLNRQKYSCSHRYIHISLYKIIKLFSKVTVLISALTMSKRSTVPYPPQCLATVNLPNQWMSNVLYLHFLSTSNTKHLSLFSDHMFPPPWIASVYLLPIFLLFLFFSFVFLYSFKNSSSFPIK